MHCVGSRKRQGTAIPEVPFSSSARINAQGVATAAILAIVASAWHGTASRLPVEVVLVAAPALKERRHSDRHKARQEQYVSLVSCGIGCNVNFSFNQQHTGVLNPFTVQWYGN